VQTDIMTLGPRRVLSPVSQQRFVEDGARVVVDTSVEAARRRREPAAFELAGPRERIFFEPAQTGAAVVTCGGLCPGLNNVVRGIVHALWYGYGVRRIYGVRSGYAGLVPGGPAPIDLDPAAVRDIHNEGGTMLGTSRGPQDPGEIAAELARLDVRVLFCIGGDGTLRGAHAIDAELRRRGQPCAVVGVPKTIDNDIPHCARSFGFHTAVEEARRAIAAAHVEARASPGGVGLVRLMGRHAGFIAATATLAQPDVNACLVPEVDFELEGRHGLLAFLERRLDEREHAVVVVAEGAGEKYLTTEGTDPSGNRRLGDIGLHLSARIRMHFQGGRRPSSLKYIDPSYIIRSVPANADDAVFCNFLAFHAVHGAMAGRTGFMVSVWNNQYVHVPFAAATADKKQIDPRGRLWGQVLESTGQPSFVADTP
jgi:6-phosphofructokinase 1